MTVTAQPAGSTPEAAPPVALVDLLDRVLAKGVVISGEVALSIADVDLVYISLRALISSVRAVTGPPSALPVEPDPIESAPPGPPPHGEIRGWRE